MLPNERTSFGFKDGISNPAIEGSGIPGTNPQEAPFKAGEFVLGYPNENGDLPPRPSPSCSAATAATSSSASSTPAWRPSASTSAPTPGVEKTRAAGRRLAAAGPAARRWCSPRSATTPSWGPIRAEQRLPLRRGRRRAGAQVPARCPRPRTYPRDSPIIGVARMHRGSSVGAPATARCCPRACWRTTEPIAASCSSASRRAWPEGSSSSRRSGSTTVPSSERPRDGPAGRAERRDSGVHRPPAADPPAPDRAAPVRGQPRRAFFMPGLRALGWIAGWTRRDRETEARSRWTRTISWCSAPPGRPGRRRAGGPRRPPGDRRRAGPAVASSRRPAVRRPRPCARPRGT